MQWIVFSIAWLTLSPVICFGSDPELYFERDVRPILKTHCFPCHGEESKLEGGLDSRLARHLLDGGESGPALVAGKSSESLLWKRIETAEMPPKGKLSDLEKQTVRIWIDQGARTARPEPSIPSEIEWTEEERSYWAFRQSGSGDFPMVRFARRNN